MDTLLKLILCSLLCKCIDSFSTFDQRQTGDLNVQVDLKDIQIIAVMKGGKEEYVDYDYAYDYSEMTIKPTSGTTVKPLNVTITTGTLNNNTTSETTPTPHEQISQSAIKSNSSSVFPETVTPALILQANVTTIDKLAVETTTVMTDQAVNKNKTATQVSNCRKGFVRNNKGNCELKLQGASNALLKIVKLSQKMKLRRDDRKNPEDILAIKNVE